MSDEEEEKDRNVLDDGDRCGEAFSCGPHQLSTLSPPVDQFLSLIEIFSFLSQSNDRSHVKVPVVKP